MSARRTAAAILTVLLLGPALAGCGSDTPPGEKVPALAAQLEQVDAAVAREDHAATRKAVEGLVAAAAAAELQEEITDEEADRILAAARQVLANLAPAESTTPAEDESTPPPTTPLPTPTDEEPDRGKDEKRDKDEKDEDKDEKKEKGD